jgi:hypothetical protein
VEFDSQGGSLVPPAMAWDVKWLIAAPAEPTKPNHKFIEWQLDGKRYEFETQEVKNDIVLKALWASTLPPQQVVFTPAELTLRPGETATFSCNVQPLGADPTGYTLRIRDGKPGLTLAKDQVQAASDCTPGNYVVETIAKSATGNAIGTLPAKVETLPPQLPNAVCHGIVAKVCVEPNPFNSHLELRQLQEGTRVMIYSPTGAPIYCSIIRGTTSLVVPTTTWPQGLYVLLMVGVDGYQRTETIMKL